MTLAALGLGANLDGGAALDPALDALAGLAAPGSLRCSTRYRSLPWGGAPGACYLNQVVLLDTALTPWDLLAATRAIEHRHGRLRGPRYAPRTLDIDVLCYQGARLRTPALTLPHPQLLNRRFALQPLAELAPELVVAPGLSALAALQRCPDRSPLQPVADAPAGGRAATCG